jgi:hypothetical protein
MHRPCTRQLRFRIIPVSITEWTWSVGLRRLRHVCRKDRGSLPPTVAGLAQAFKSEGVNATDRS